MKQRLVVVTGMLLLAGFAYGQSTLPRDNTAPMEQPGTNANTMQNNINAIPPSTAPTTTTPSATAQQTMQTAKHGNMPITFTPDSIQWKDAPNMLPAGAQYAILEGNPKSKGDLTIRIKMPANYQIPPVYVVKPERITVLTGTFNLGVGNTLDTNSGMSFPAGSFILVPGQKHHFAWTSEDTVIQISGRGPWLVKYVNSKDDPRNKSTNNPAQSQPAPSQTVPQPNSQNGMGNPEQSQGTPTDY